MFSETELRVQICEIARRIYERGYSVAADGNLSVRLEGGDLLVTPSGVFKGNLYPEDIVRTSADGGLRASPRGLRPSGELLMHLAIYRVRPDVQAVVHAHPPIAVGFTLAGVSLAQCLLPEVILSFGDIPTAPYSTPTTAAVPEAISELIRTSDALMLARHGSLTVGQDLESAYHRLEQIEHTARITLAARQLGEVKPLPKDEVDRLLEMRRRLGLGPVAEPCNNCGACLSPASERMLAGSRSR